MQIEEITKFKMRFKIYRMREDLGENFKMLLSGEWKLIDKEQNVRITL